jgi:alcohol dehydrogenase (cytochrome c)
VPVLFDAVVAGQKRKLISITNRNAFYYVLDRVNGEFITGRPYARQTWAQGLGAKGKPIVASNSQPTSGKPLWDFQTGGSIIANPVSFTVEGHECIAIAADRVLYVFSL